jgi:actin-like ATPase involved in cell morphogenesis
MKYKMIKLFCLVPDTYLVVDCGGGTVDLTVRTLLPDKTLEEDTVRSGGLCGSTFVDQEFIKFLRRVVGSKAMEDFKKNNYGSLQKLIYKFFCPEVKLPFDGDPSEFETIELDLEKYCPALIPYISGEAKDKLESEDWIIDLEFEDVKRMFDPVVNEIIDLINTQLESLPKRQKVKIMFLVGGFSESTYLFKRVKNVFKNDIPNITSPSEPIAAIAKGIYF